MNNKKQYQELMLYLHRFSEEEIYTDIISTSGGDNTTYQQDPFKGDGWTDTWIVG